jgi:hypothetical protein
VLDITFQHFNLSLELEGLLIVGFLGLLNDANCPSQYSPKGGGIKVGDVHKKCVQQTGRDRNWRESWRNGLYIHIGSNFGSNNSMQ